MAIDFNALKEILKKKIQTDPDGVFEKDDNNAYIVLSDSLSSGDQKTLRDAYQEILSEIDNNPGPSSAKAKQFKNLIDTAIPDIAPPQEVKKFIIEKVLHPITFSFPEIDNNLKITFSLSKDTLRYRMIYPNDSSMLAQPILHNLISKELEKKLKDTINSSNKKACEDFSKDPTNIKALQESLLFTTDEKIKDLLEKKALSSVTKASIDSSKVTDVENKTDEEIQAEIIKLNTVLRKREAEASQISPEQLKEYIIDILGDGKEFKFLSKKETLELNQIGISSIDNKLYYTIDGKQTLLPKQSEQNPDGINQEQYDDILKQVNDYDKITEKKEFYKLPPETKTILNNYFISKNLIKKPKYNFSIGEDKNISKPANDFKEDDLIFFTKYNMSEGTTSLILRIGKEEMPLSLNMNDAQQSKIFNIISDPVKMQYQDKVKMLELSYEFNLLTGKKISEIASNDASRTSEIVAVVKEVDYKTMNETQLKAAWKKAADLKLYSETVVKEDSSDVIANEEKVKTFATAFNKLYKDNKLSELDELYNECLEKKNTDSKQIAQKIQTVENFLAEYSAVLSQSFRSSQLTKGSKYAGVVLDDEIKVQMTAGFNIFTKELTIAKSFASVEPNAKMTGVEFRKFANCLSLINKLTMLDKILTTCSATQIDQLEFVERKVSATEPSKFSKLGVASDTSKPKYDFLLIKDANVKISDNQVGIFMGDTGPSYKIGTDVYSDIPFTTKQNLTPLLKTLNKQQDIISDTKLIESLEKMVNNRKANQAKDIKAGGAVESKDKFLLIKDASVEIDPDQVGIFIDGDKLCCKVGAEIDNSKTIPFSAQKTLKELLSSLDKDQDVIVDSDLIKNLGNMMKLTTQIRSRQSSTAEKMLPLSEQERKEIATISPTLSKIKPSKIIYTSTPKDQFLVIANQNVEIDHDQVGIFKDGDNKLCFKVGTNIDNDTKIPFTAQKPLNELLSSLGRDLIKPLDKIDKKDKDLIKTLETMINNRNKKSMAELSEKTSEELSKLSPTLSKIIPSAAKETDKTFPKQDTQSSKYDKYDI
jgi:hypothetical protein